MDYSKRDGYRVLFNLNQRELYSLLKCQIQMTLVFDNKGKFEFIDLLERTLTNGVQMIYCSDGVKAPSLITYAELIKLIQVKMSTGILSIEILQEIAKEKESLIVIVGQIKTSVVDSCVYLDYNDGMFSVINKPLAAGLPDKLYFFEQNSNILFFGKDGPKIITKSNYENIEDLICD